MARATLNHNDTLCKNVGSGTAQAVKRILAVYDSATADERLDGAIWYHDAHAQAVAIGEQYGISTDRVAGVISALSPRMPWSRNVKVAREVIETGTTGALGKNVEMANAVLASGVDAITGEKRINFTANILGDTQAVTIDAWAARIALGVWDTDRLIGLAGMYGAMANAYRIAAKRRGVSPSTMQAITWVAIRNNPTTVKGA